MMGVGAHAYPVPESEGRKDQQFKGIYRMRKSCQDYMGEGKV